LGELIRAGVGRQFDVEEIGLEGGVVGGCGEWLAAGRRGDDGEELERSDGGTRDEDALGVGANVGRGEEEPGVVDEVVEEGGVDGGEAFEEFRGAVVGGGKGNAEPEAFGAGAGEEGTTGQAFGIEGVGEVEIANVADESNVVERDGDDAAVEVEELDGGVADEGGEGEVAGEDFTAGAPDDNFFVRGGHG
jgi:hypothetical protein